MLEDLFCSVLTQNTIIYDKLKLLLTQQTKLPSIYTIYAAFHWWPTPHIIKTAIREFKEKLTAKFRVTSSV